MNLQGTPHLPLAQRLSHSRQSPLLHRSRLGPCAAASSLRPPALPRTAFARQASVSMVTVHKPPCAAGGAVSARRDVEHAGVGAEKGAPRSTQSIRAQRWKQTTAEGDQLVLLHPQGSGDPGREERGGPARLSTTEPAPIPLRMRGNARRAEGGCGCTRGTIPTGKRRG